MKNKIKISIAGGTGYTGGELLRILYQHPFAEVISVSSTSIAGKEIHHTHPDLEGLYSLKYSSMPDLSADVLFLCLGHGVSKQFLNDLDLPKKIKIIDLSNDFRLNDDAIWNDLNFVYGLPELQREQIQQADYIANPGCFATAIQLALLPLAKAQLIQQEVHISAVTGSTGAGVKPSATTHFSWRNDNISAYKVFTHQHLGEIKESLQQLQHDFQQEIHFVPMRGDFSRGIFANVYTPTSLNEQEAVQLYQTYYQNHPFVQVSEKNISMKNAVNTNRCFLQITVINGKVMIHSAIDNLVKGASGQAVQNMNLIFNFPETTGLTLKPQLL